MPRENREGERLTEDESARRKLGPRGVPGGQDFAKMTPQQEKNSENKWSVLKGGTTITTTVAVWSK
jgi:hypothetical protein